MDDKYRYITKIFRNMQTEKNRTTDTLTETEREALRFISKHQNVINSDLVKHLGVNKALVSRICQKLESLDLISSETGVDKRTKLLNITSLGQSYKLDLQSFEANYYRDILAGVKEEDLAIFFKVLEQAYLKSKARRKALSQNE